MGAAVSTLHRQRQKNDHKHLNRNETCTRNS